MTFPLPNEFKHAGDLCPKSFASQVQNHVRPAEAEGWGICVDCGEVVNTRGKTIPEHRIPVADPIEAPTKDTISRHLRNLHGYDIAYAVASAPAVLLAEHERIHATLAADRINHTHKKEADHG